MIHLILIKIGGFLLLKLQKLQQNPVDNFWLWQGCEMAEFMTSCASG